ncbi:hypothetical protein AB0C51_07290 [Streptomyces pathocidini]|uniref:DUF7848 domain-containing protein n=1 Tax=Streptomyces pathocidini TaxID=1650571 RepID=A0ABW7UUL9_9ACTN|nr:hypothetical protein [Streptomyces pathocidini]
MSVHTADGRSGRWSMIREPAPEAPSAVFEMECTSCGHASGPAEDPEAARAWAVRHVAGAPAHTGFREVVHHFWRALPNGG